MLFTPALIAVVATGATSPVPGDLAFLQLTDGVWQVWVSGEDGDSARQVTRSLPDKTRMSWYPGANRILVSASDGRAYRTNLADGREVPVGIELVGFQDAVLSPDASRIAFSISTSGSVDDHDIWVVDEDGSNPLKLTSMPWLQHEPTWSPDGRYVYFLSGNGEQSHDIWRVGLADRRTEQLTANQLYHFDLSISEKGDLAFSTNREGQYDLWIRSSNGREQRLTHDAALDARPTWSPDGSRMAFESIIEGRPSIWRINRDGGGRIRLTDPSVSSRYPVWLPKGPAK